MDAKVLDFVSKKEEQIEKKRRRFERILFDNLLGAYSVIHQEGAIFAVELIDISRDGCLFRTYCRRGKSTFFEVDSELPLRMYFARDSYLPVVVTVKHRKRCRGEDGREYMQYGCEFDKSMPSFEAMESFIDFLYKFARYSSRHSDEGSKVLHL